MGSSLVGSLAGLRVLDFSRVLAGPLSTQILADLGAEVLKVERPGTGDDTRSWGPPFQDGESAYFLCLNRGKRSLVLDLNSPEGRERALRLAERADVVVENFSTGWLESRGLGPDRLLEANPRLVYLSLTGYGHTGPDAGEPGYDFLIQARGGLMAITGEPEGAPMKVGVALVDVMAGLYGAVGVLAALQQRETTGAGLHLDLSLLDCQVAGLVNVASNYLVSGEEPARYGNAHPNIVPYELFETADEPLVLAVGNDEQWRRCAAVLGAPEWACDPRFARNPDRVRNRQALRPLLSARFAARTRGEWLADLRAAGVPAGPVLRVSEALADPQVLARGMVREVEHSRAGSVRVVANPLLRDETPPAPPPCLGEGGEELERRWLA